MGKMKTLRDLEQKSLFEIRMNKERELVILDKVKFLEIKNTLVLGKDIRQLGIEWIKEDIKKQKQSFLKEIERNKKNGQEHEYCKHFFIEYDYADTFSKCRLKDNIEYDSSCFEKCNKFEIRKFKFSLYGWKNMMRFLNVTEADLK